MTGTHMFTRPGSACGTCRVPWPCPPTRRHLLRRIDDGHTVAVARQLGQYLATAVADRPDLPMMTLYRQLFGWLLTQPPRPGRVGAARRRPQHDGPPGHRTGIVVPAPPLPGRFACPS